jgi:hypothetical protein
MANAGRQQFGEGVQGKGDGTGAMTDIEPDLPENAVLHNRDKQQHTEARGLDSKHVQTEQRQDHSANRQPELRRQERASRSE